MAPNPATPAALDAKNVLDKLMAANIGLTNGAAQDENTDPNNLLGRPNGYLSRALADMLVATMRRSRTESTGAW